MRKPYARHLRLNSQLQQVIAARIRDLRDPQIALVTVTGVDAAPDLRQARVRVSVLGDDAALDAAVKALNRAAGRLRHALGQELALRYLPRLRFEPDLALREGDRIAGLIRKAVQADAEHAPKPSEGESDRE